MVESLEYARFAFEFMEKVERLANTDEVMDVVERVLAPLGLTNATFAPIPRPGERFERTIWAITKDPYAAEWHKIYSDEGYAEVDALMRLLRRSAWLLVPSLVGMAVFLSFIELTMRTRNGSEFPNPQKSIRST